MIVATADELLSFVAAVIETVERYGAIVVPPDDTAEVALVQHLGNLRFDLVLRLPASRRWSDADLTLSELWEEQSAGLYTLAEYGYELRDHERDYRRALHRHDVDHFVRTYDVATHQHCEATMGRPLCDHYSGLPVYGAIDGFRRLYAEWVAGTKPDCSRLTCLG